MSSHIAGSSQQLWLPFVMETLQVFASPYIADRSAMMQKEPVVLHPPPSAVAGREEQRGWVWLVPVGSSSAQDVRLEGGPLHCKRVSSRSHSEPVSFPAVSCHSG